MITFRLNYPASVASIFVLLGWPTAVLASEGGAAQVDLTNSATGFLALGIFVFAYALVMAEEFTHLRKSKPVILAAGIIWVLAAAAYPGNDPRGWASSSTQYPRVCRTHVISLGGYDLY